MKIATALSSAAVVLLSFLCAARASQDDGASPALGPRHAARPEEALVVKEPAALPRLADVLDRVRANLPREAIHIRGELLCGPQRGKLDRAFYLDAQLQLGQSPASATYILRDRFGDVAEQMAIARQSDGTWRRNYAKGRPLEGAPPPALDSLIGGSDVTWNDLSLGFLWWTNGAVTARERLLERECLVLEFTPPQASRLTRVWIDEALLLIIKVEEYDAQGTLQRRVAVRTFKKIGDTWIIKDMDIRRWPGNHRTLIRLNDVTVASGVAVSDP